VPEVVAVAYKGEELRFGREVSIPKPLDPRLIEVVAPAVPRPPPTAGVARRPIVDMEAYRQQLSRFVYQSGNAMQPVFSVAKGSGKSCCWRKARTSACCAVVVDEVARPLLRPAFDDRRADQDLRLRLEPADCEIIDPHDARSIQMRRVYHARRKRAAFGRAGVL
jgi:malate dehydrogenase (oxaloacetate-decarboxylating)(NADP+)